MIVEYVDQRDVQKKGGLYAKFPSSFIVCNLRARVIFKRFCCIIIHMIGELIILLILAMAIPVTFSFSASSLAELLGALFAIKTTKNKTYIIQLLLALISSMGYGLLLLLEFYYAFKILSGLGF